MTKTTAIFPTIGTEMEEMEIDMEIDTKTMIATVNRDSLSMMKTDN